MRKLIIIFASIVGFFLVGTLVFMLFHYGIFGHYGAGDWLRVLVHSIPQDLTTAGYVVALPLVLKLVHIWLPGEWYRHVLYWLLGLLFFVVLLLWITDLVLFGYWGFRLDATPLIYLLDNPAEALASATWWMYVVGIGTIILILYLIERLLHKLLPPAERTHSHLWREEAAKNQDPLGKRVLHTLGGLLLAGLTFLCIRGGVSESTMNVGRAYFSTEMNLNQAAVNPVFSFFYSLGKQKKYGEMYRFMSDEECDAALEELDRMTVNVADSASVCPTLLKPPRPNILLIILESFSGKACSALYPDADPRVMPELTRLYGEGLGWTRFYATSWRTDRGLASILAGYPAQPTTTVMKDQSKCNNLQYLPKRLKEEGYRPQFVYGGDVNFTNMLGFLRTGGVEEVVSMNNFSRAERMQQWGAPDHLVFDRVLRNIREEVSKKEAPFFKVVLTLSSHEPYDVPSFKRLEHPFANSFAYTDSCLGDFISKLKADPAVWDNLLVIAMPDHCSYYPEGVEFQEPDRYHIPMVWTGGALQLPTDGEGKEIHAIDALGDQTDFAATLLGQMGIHHEDFNFSKDLLDPTTPRYAFYDYPDGFGILADVCDSTGVRTLMYMQDNRQVDVPLKWSHDTEGLAQRWGKAYLQRVFDDLDKR
ncbi:MAG: sulfatase-like hydrolase/transferase [Bacteroidales bacterium]|nr:sulfatase-like hydrolase/transferase [Bacteroidales bacterium]